MDIVVDLVIDILPPCQYGSIFIRRSTPLIILRLPKPALEFTYVTASSSFATTINSWVLTSRSINYVMKVMCMYCDTIAIVDTSFGYELIWCQSSTIRFMSPRASENALSYTHRVRNGITIAANDRTLNLTTLYWCQICCDLQLPSFVKYQPESIQRHSGHMNRKSYSPIHKECGRTKG